MEATVLSNIGNEQSLLQRAIDYRTRTKKSNAALARNISYSREAVSRFFSGDYNSDDFELKLTAFLDAEEGVNNTPPKYTANIPKKRDFFETKDAKNIIGLCTKCQSKRKLGIVIGASGFGKTSALEYYARMPKTIYIRCRSVMGSRDMLKLIEKKMIEKKLGIPRSYGSVTERIDEICEFFEANRGYLLIIDEAHKLISKNSVTKMDVIRDIYDISGVGVVIAGEPALEVKLKMYLDSGANRTLYRHKLAGLSKNEVKGYFEGFDIDEDALAEMTNRACNSQTGCFRLLDNTLENVIDLLADSGNTRITLDVIKKASDMMVL